MTKRLFVLLAAAVLILAAFGCSDDDGNPTGSGGSTAPTNFTDTSTFDAGTGVWTGTLAATDPANPTYLSFTDGGITKSISVVTWDVSFAKSQINLNGGTSSDGGSVMGADLGEVDFDAVTIADTAGAKWVEDADYAVIDWLDYNMTTHEVESNQLVYTMKDAEGDNYIKLRVDSVINASFPPFMGTIYLSYFYQSTVNSTALDGAVTQVELVVNDDSVFFDFSSGMVVNPPNPANSNMWDILLYNYDIRQNTGHNGTGNCSAYPAYQELGANGTDIDAFTSQDPQAPMFRDFRSSVFVQDLIDDTKNWYNYDGDTHRVTSRGRTYLINTGADFFKLQILSYITNIEGVPQPGYYTVEWKQL